MAKDQGAVPTTLRPRGPTRTAPAAAPPPAKPFNPVDWITAAPKFFREVRAEARKVTWTSRKETWITSVMVFIMVVTVSLFLFLVDFLLNLGVGGIIRLGS